MSTDITEDTWIWDCASQTVAYAGETWDPQVHEDFAGHAARIESEIEAGAAHVVRPARTVTVPAEAEPATVS